MSQDRRTKSELLAELGNCHAAREQALADADAFAARLSSLDPEAMAIAEVVEALDRLTGYRGEDQDVGNFAALFTDGAGRDYAQDPRRPRDSIDVGRPDVARVLSYAASRFGLPDPQAQVEQLSDELGRVNADLHRTRQERDELRHGIRQLQHPDPQF